MHHSDERTLVLIKPDGVQRSLVGEIIQRFERSGLKLAGMKFLVTDEGLIEKHYLSDPNWREKTGKKTIASYEEKGEDKQPPSDDPEEMGQIILDNLKEYMTVGPSVVMCWQGAHAAKLVRKLVGGTQPLEADIGTIRGDFVMDSYEMSDADGRAVRNLVHASGDKEEAKEEIDLWFDDEELVDYSIVQEKILYDVNLDGILE
jgi:nucleoside-diphosphate kinase